jgi:hypothetical protein
MSLSFAIAFLAALGAAQPVAAASTAAVTYQCHSPSKSRDIFMRFNADGSREIGADAKDLKPTGEVIFFDKPGVAMWSRKRGNITETNTFDKSTGKWIWDPGTQFEGLSQYACKPI